MTTEQPNTPRGKTLTAIFKRACEFVFGVPADPAVESRVTLMHSAAYTLLDGTSSFADQLTHASLDARIARAQALLEAAKART